MKKYIESLFHSVEQHVKPGKKYSKLYPLFEAFESFALSVRTVTQKAPFIRDFIDTKRYMNLVILSMLPCLIFGIFNVGYQSHLAAGLPLDIVSIMTVGIMRVIPLLIISYGVGLGWEFLSAIIRGHEVSEGYLVSAMLIVLTLPPTIPLWQAAVGVTFGVIVGKEVFGGSGRNFLNPALTTRAFLFFSFPAQLSGDTVWTYLMVGKDQLIDGYSGATALAVAASATGSVTDALVTSGFTLSHLFFGLVPGSIGETSTLLVLVGAAFLLLTGVASWRTMLGSVIGLVAMSSLLMVFSTETTVPFLSLPPHWHMVMGSFAFGTVYMATDPVSSPSLHASKWIYGIMIGVLTVIIRCINPAYPEGVMLAILLMNVFAPALDHIFVQRHIKGRIPNVI